MLIVTVIDGTLSAFNTRYIQRLALTRDNTEISNYTSATVLLRGDDLTERFEDITKAAAAGLPLYDTREPISYWRKRKKETNKETNPKQNAPAPEAPSK